MHSWARRGQRAVLARPPSQQTGRARSARRFRGDPDAVPRGPPDQGRMDRRCCTPMCVSTVRIQARRPSRTREPHQPCCRQQATTRLWRVQSCLHDAELVPLGIGHDRPGHTMFLVGVVLRRPETA